jgi:putative aldouronate transport system permease protein
MKSGKKMGGYIRGGGLRGFGHNLKLDIRRNRILYVFLGGILLYFFVFHYIPMGGLLMSFQKYSPAKGIFGSKWVGMRNFVDFFSGPYVGRLIRNTTLIGLLDLAVNFPAPIIFALLLNEIRQRHFKKIIQTVSYMPYFISAVVACGLVINFTQAGGIISNLLAPFHGGQSINLLNDHGSFRTIYVSQNLWQGIGYGSIIYLAALSGVDQELYDAARIDGAGRWRQTLHVTIPGIMPTVVMMFILRMGVVFSVGADKILLLYNPANYEVADVINTYVFRMGVTQQDYGLSTAVGLINSFIGTIMLLGSNRILKKLTDTSMF